MLGSALSLALIGASVVVIYLRLHHPSFSVTGVAITQQVRTGCSVDLTGRITTNGAAGTVSYEWLYQPQSAGRQPRSQSASAGEPGLYVTDAINGQGHGTTAQTVTLQVLAPGHANASAHVVVSC